MFKVNDLFIRNILNIKYDLVIDSKYEFILRNKSIPYYYKNKDLLSYGYIIKTYNGFYDIPVIGMKNVRKKKEINKELIYISNKKNIIRTIINNTKISKDIIKNIILKYIYN
tara:strand:- start:244 stop:579 length:336 start_codon:yes stop_codon:yes gene_type:complete